MKEKMVNLFRNFYAADFELQRKLLLECMLAVVSFIVVLCYLFTAFDYKFLLATLFLFLVVFAYCSICFYDIANNKFVKYQGRCIDLDVSRSSVTLLIEDDDHNRYKLRVSSKKRRKIQVDSKIYFYAKNTSVLPIEESVFWVKNYFVLNTIR